MFHWVKNRVLAKSLKYWAHSCSQPKKLNRKNTQPEIMCDIFFEKAKGQGGTVNITSVYAEAAVRSVL